MRIIKLWFITSNDRPSESTFHIAVLICQTTTNPGSVHRLGCSPTMIIWACIYLNSAPSRSSWADALGTCFLASVNQHTISPQITMICSNFGPWQMFILFCMLERCGRHDNAFSFSYYRSSIDSSRLSEIQGIQHCPSYQDTWFCVITSFYGIVVSMVSFKPSLLYSRISMTISRMPVAVLDA
jgi:hypothetical protein